MHVSAEISVIRQHEGREVEVTARYDGNKSKYRPAVMYLPNGDPGYPAEGGEVEEADFVEVVECYYTDDEAPDKDPRELGFKFDGKLTDDEFEALRERLEEQDEDLDEPDPDEYYDRMREDRYDDRY